MGLKYAFNGVQQLDPNSGLPNGMQQIVALIAFSNVNIGDTGGFIQSERNLLQEGNCWVYDTSVVSEDAVVSGNAVVKNGAYVHGTAQITGNQVIDGSDVSNNVWAGSNVTMVNK